LFKARPAARGLRDLLEPPARLGEMRLDAEVNPRRCVAVGLVAAALDLLQDTVVVEGVRTQVFLDRRELG
jgi:hypothetical protein